MLVFLSASIGYVRQAMLFMFGGILFMKVYI